MLSDWLLGLPWPVVALGMLALCLLTVVGFSFVSFRFDAKDRTNDNMGRAALAFLSSAFIFVGAFTIITSWNEDSAMRATAQTEVVAAQRLVHEVATLAPADTTVRTAVTDYAEAVLDGETGVDGQLAPSSVAADKFVLVEKAATVVAQQPGNDFYRAGQVRDALDDLKSARQDRQVELYNTIAVPLIALLLLMAALNLIGIGLFPSGTSRLLKFTFGILVAVSAAGLLTGVIVLESPPFVHHGLARPFESLVTDLNGS